MITGVVAPITNAGSGPTDPENLGINTLGLSDGGGGLRLPDTSAVPTAGVPAE